MCRQLFGMPRSPMSQVTMWADSGESVQKSHCMLLSRVWESARRFCEWMKSENFCGSRMKKNGGVVAHHVGGPEFPGHRGEPQEHVGPLAGLEEVSLGELAYVLGDLEDAVSGAALGVYDPLGDPLPVEMGHLLEQVVVLQQDRSVGTEREGMLVAGRGDTGICRGRRRLFRHNPSFSFSVGGGHLSQGAPVGRSRCPLGSRSARVDRSQSGSQRRKGCRHGKGC